MKFLRFSSISLLFALAFSLAACHGDGNDGGAVVPPEEAPPALELSFSDAPIELPGIAASYVADMAYGEGERNFFDIYLPDSDEPTPLVIFFHGGAYVEGDKSIAHERQGDDIREFLGAGIAFATINYHLLSIEGPRDEGVLRSLTESARALQFMRYYAHSLNIDPEQVVSYGVSAGASTSLWLGTHDDLADPDSEDPVLRESTRLKAVGALYTQATINVLRWEEILLPVVEPLIPIFGGSDILTIAGALGADGLLFTVVGMESFEELHTDAGLAYLEDIDTLAQMDAGDAPIYAYNDLSFFDDLFSQFLHHTLHAIFLHDRAQEVGLHNVIYAIDPVYALEDPSGEKHVSFLMRHLR